MVSIELPRPNDELADGRALQLLYSGQQRSYRVINFDGKCLTFAGCAPSQNGELLDLMIDGATLPGSVADLDEGRFSFAVKGGTTAQQALLSALYTARFSDRFHDVSPLRVAGSLVQRLFR